jgi:hypothetical protein
MTSSVPPAKIKKSPYCKTAGLPLRNISENKDVALQQIGRLASSEYQRKHRCSLAANRQACLFGM